jgi:hypothetical protein
MALYFDYLPTMLKENQFTDNQHLLMKRLNIAYDLYFNKLCGLRMLFFYFCHYSQAYLMTDRRMAFPFTSSKVP